MIKSLLVLNDDSLARLLTWLYAVDSKQRRRMLDEVGSLSAAELERVASMSDEVRSQLLGLDARETEGWLPKEVAAGIDSATQKIRARRARRRKGAGDE